MYKKQNGQTLIETALILFLLLVILLGITEFSRAWFLKNSFKNAVRQGARVAAVTTNTAIPLAPFACTCPITDPNPDTAAIKNAICCQPGVAKPGVLVTFTCSDPVGAIIPCNAVAANDTVEARIEYSDPSFFIVGGGVWPWPKSLNFTYNSNPTQDSSIKASMRYE